MLPVGNSFIREGIECMRCARPRGYCGARSRDGRWVGSEGVEDTGDLQEPGAEEFTEGEDSREIGGCVVKDE